MFYITLELTKLCTLHCDYCLNSNKVEEKNSFVNIKKFSKFLSKLYKRNSENKEIRIHLFGGEPSLTPLIELEKLFKIFEQFQKKYPKTKLTYGFQTNFTFNKQKAEEILRLKKQYGFYVYGTLHIQKLFNNKILLKNVIDNYAKFGSGGYHFILDKDFATNSDSYLCKLKEYDESFSEANFNALLFNPSHIPESIPNRDELLLLKKNLDYYKINISNITLGDNCAQSCSAGNRRFYYSTDNKIFLCYPNRLFAPNVPLHKSSNFVSFKELEKKTEFVRAFNQEQSRLFPYTCPFFLNKVTILSKNDPQVALYENYLSNIIEILKPKLINKEQVKY